MAKFTKTRIREHLIDTMGGNESILAKDYNLIDATEPLVFTPKPRDHRGSTPSDPGNCINARCLRRRGRPAVFFKSVAYVLRDRYTVEKYSIPKRTGDMEAYFDATGKSFAGFPVKLMKPSGSYKVGGRTGDKSTGSTGRSLTAAERQARSAARQAAGSDSRVACAFRKQSQES
jgi:hypothetical protein